MRMRRLITAGLLVGVSTGLAGCGQTGESSAPTSTTTTTGLAFHSVNRGLTDGDAEPSPETAETSSGALSSELQRSCEVNVKTVLLSAEGYMSKNGAYPGRGRDADLVSSAGRGGLLRSWPEPSGYSLDWTGTEVEVFKTNVTPAVSTGFGLPACASLTDPSQTASNGSSQGDDSSSSDDSSTAESNLRDALVGAVVIFTDNEKFPDTLTLVAGLTHDDPSLMFVPAATPSNDEETISVRVVGNDTIYLATLSKTSGNCLSMRHVATAGAITGTYRNKTMRTRCSADEAAADTTAVWTAM